MEHKLLCLLFLIGLLSLSSCQNAAPQFRTLARDGVDGNLYDRLTVKGIEENLPTGSLLGQLGCADRDGDAITYRGEGNTLLVNSTGTVIMNRLLDRENSPANSVSNTGAQILVHRFFCNDGRLTATATIEITITDKNDNPPTFLSSTAYSGRMREDAVPGLTTRIPGLVIQVTDIDRGLNAVVDITCFADDEQAKDACDHFDVTSVQTGEGKYNSTIYLKKSVDYETQRGYTMTLLARDRGVTGEPRYSSTVNVLIEVEDTQDSLPEFLNVPLTIYVQENIAVGTSLTPLISAQDQDQGNPRAIEISIVNDTKGLFQMGPSIPIDATNKAYQATVVTRQNIDREELQGKYIFQVKAEELFPNGTKSGLFTVSDVTVNILDVNDNQPTFQNTNYNVSLTEMDSNGTQTNSQVPNLNIQVTDIDDSSNANYYVTIGRQTYPGAFRVSPSDNSTGTTAVNMLILNSDFLDFDNPNYRRQIVVIEARELTSLSTPKTSSATVTINLLDLNDNSPIFVQGQYERTLREDSAINTPIITITATDKDMGENGRITYSLRGTDLDVFNLNSATGEIRLNKILDYETQTEYPIILVARDNGQPSRESTKTFTLKVSDYNDLGPRFVQDSYQTYVFETSLQLQPAVTVKAEDPENKTGVTYRIVAGNINNAFNIDPNTGVLTLTKNIDYDDTPGQSGKIELIVEASDGGVNGEPGLRSNATVIIDVQDENNNSPIFNPPSYSKTISEVAISGTEIVVVTASDSDNGENGLIRYTIDRGGLDNFEINEDSGMVTISQRAQLDFDLFPRYELVVYAIDKGGPPKTGTTTVTITVTDANNKPPQIPSEIYNVNVRDDVSIGHVVININATDPDSGSNLEYSLYGAEARDSGGNIISAVSQFDYREAFKVDPSTGVVRTNLKLGRDLAAQIGFRIEAKDTNSVTGIQTATTSVLVVVLGTQTSAITFNSPWTPSNPFYRFTVNEGQAVFSDIVTLSGRDPTCGCALVNFTKIKDTGNYFRLDGSIVRLNRTLDYERLKSLEMEVRGFSQDGKRSVTATIIITVGDDNDNSPVFGQPDGYTFSVGEYEKYPFTVGTIDASDADSGSYGSVEYSLTGQNVNDFYIHPTEGKILVSPRTQLNYETRKSYSLQAIARDNPRASTSGSELRRQTSVSLTILVEDENDNAPTFGENTVYAFYTVESYPIGSIVGTVVATDGDSGTNNQISYFIQSATADAAQFFSINEANGQIITIGSLREKAINSPYRLIITARDNGNPPQSSMVSVTIHVSDGQLNDGSPLFSYPGNGERITVVENSPIGTEVITVKATSRIRAPIEYLLTTTTGGNGDVSKFAINKTTGDITVNGLIDREIQSQYTFLVVARDTVNKSQTLKRLFIDVIDVDDNPPSFSPEVGLRYPACKDKGLVVPVELRMPEERPINTYVYTVKACDPDEDSANAAEYFPVLSDGMCKREMEKNDFVVSSNGSIYTNKRLDREIQETYLICVGVRAVVGGRKKRAVFNVSEMVNTDRIAYIEVTVTDLNDNRPTFPVKQMQQGLPSVPKSEAVTTVSATDNDLSPYNRIRYSITNIQYYDGETNFPLPGAFTIHPDTGIISVKLPSYTDFSGNYFVVDILAQDFYNSAMNDSASVTIYIFDEPEILRLVLDSPPDVSIETAGNIITELNAVSDESDFKLQEISYHTNNQGSKDVSKTDVCFVVVREKRVLSVQEGERIMAERENYQNVLSKYGVTDTGNCYRASASADKVYWADLWWVLVFVAVFIFVCCVILIIATCILHRNYKRYMNTRKTYMIPQ
ncbi:hypothetical protein SNE40_005217 [Patella caerulea]|uniref:Cadherin domain-containing protein n=1 Tax=Patella caerulea TaxID=87958 RepID=A0AAN8QB30_PATCE